MDISSAKSNSKQNLDSLTNHGAQTGTPLSAHEEMSFMKKCYEVIAPKLLSSNNSNQDKVCAPKGVWNCLNSAIHLRPPVLVLPSVSDMVKLQSLSSMTEYGISSASLSSPGMIDCLKAAGG